VMIGGLLLSYYLNLPSGAVIVLTGSTVFSLTFVAHSLCRHRRQKRQSPGSNTKISPGITIDNKQ